MAKAALVALKSKLAGIRLNISQLEEAEQKAIESYCDEHGVGDVRVIERETGKVIRTYRVTHGVWNGGLCNSSDTEELCYENMQFTMKENEKTVLMRVECPHYTTELPNDQLFNYKDVQILVIWFE